MEQDITNHLRELFNPTAIILHGSRAVGRERPHSDWDIILLFKETDEVPASGRMFWQDQNIEYAPQQLPIDDIEKTFGIKLQLARVLYEHEHQGGDLLEKAKQLYSQPLGWSSQQKHSHKLWMQGRVDGMRDTIDQPLVFERYASDFYARVTNYWYLALYDTHTKPIYLALDEIKVKDPEYYTLIETFVSETDRQQKLVAAKRILERCFG